MNRVVKYYSVNDKVAGMFGPMFPAVNDGVAKRMFRKLLSDVDNFKEYELWLIGEFNESDGEFSKSLVCVCNGEYLLEVNK